MAGDDAVANLHPGKQSLARSGRDQNPLAFERRGGRRRFALDLAERHRMRPGDSRVSLEVVDLVFPKQVEHALGELVGRLPRPRNHLGEIEPHLADLDAVLFGGAANRIHRARRIEQRLGRNTSPIKTNAPRPIPLDHCDAHLELRRPNRGDIPARPRTNHNKVIPRIFQDEVLTKNLLIIVRMWISGKGAGKQEGAEEMRSGLRKAFVSQGRYH